MRNQRVCAASLGSAGNIGSGGGRPTMERMVEDIRELHYSLDQAATPVDFYGFRDKRDLSINGLDTRLAQAASTVVPDCAGRRCSGRAI